MPQKIFFNLLLILFTGFRLFALEAVKLSEFTPSRNDATKAFKAAIASGASQIIVDNPGFPIQLDAIRLRSNLELIFEDGVIVEAKKSAFKSLGAFLFTAVNCNNITLRGKGKVILRMRKKDYQNKDMYRHSEWRHLLGLKGCTKVKIQNLTLESSGGDGIYLGTTPQTPYCKDIILEDLVISDHHRQGISVISAENLIIRRCTISNTAGTPPAAGIDFEPNSKPKGQRLINCLVEDCIISGNEGTGLEFYTVYMENSPAQSITVRNCLIKNNHHSGISITTSFHRKGREKTPPPSGAYKFENCKVIGNEGPAIKIRDQYPGVKLTFENCILEPGKDSRSYPVLLAAQKMKEAPIGGIVFRNVTVTGLPSGREVMPFKRWHSSSVTDISGDIFIKTTNGKKRFPLENHIRQIQRRVADDDKSKFKAADSSWRKFGYIKPVSSKSEMTFPGIKTRDRFYYVLWASKNEKVNITARLANPDAVRRVNLKLESAGGKEIFKSELNSKNKIAAIKFTAPETGTYLLSGASGGEQMLINSDHPGGWWVYKRSLMVSGKHNKLFFAVPEGVRNFELEVAGYLGAPYVKATVYNTQGKIVDSNKSIEQPYRFKLKRHETKRQIWSLDIETASPKNAALIRPGKNLEGLFADSPVKILKLNK